MIGQISYLLTESVGVRNLYSEQMNEHLLHQ